MMLRVAVVMMLVFRGVGAVHADNGDRSSVSVQSLEQLEAMVEQAATKIEILKRRIFRLTEQENKRSSDGTRRRLASSENTASIRYDGTQFQVSSAVNISSVLSADTCICNELVVPPPPPTPAPTVCLQYSESSVGKVCLTRGTDLGAADSSCSNSNDECWQCAADANCPSAELWTGNSTYCFCCPNDETSSMADFTDTTDPAYPPYVLVDSC